MEQKNRRHFNLVLITLLFASGITFADEKASLVFITSLNPLPGAPRPASTVPAVSGVTTGKTSQPDLFFQKSNELSILGGMLIRFYQVVISPLDIPSCPFEPTDSEYARQAISKYGIITGIIMASDRYQRCNGFGAWYYQRSATGRLVDPPEKNLP